MSSESHASPTGSSTSSLFAGGGGNAGANEPMTQSSPAKPTWAQILNSNSSSSSANASGSNNSVANNKTKAVSPSTGAVLNTNASRSGQMSNFNEQQPSQSQMNWSMNYGSSSAWMVDDDSQKHSTNPTNASQQSMDGGDHSTNYGNATASGGGDGFDRLESSSPASERNKSVMQNNSTGNGWSNMQQPHSTNNPSRSISSSNQWPDITNFYGTNSSNTAGSFNFSQHSNDSSTNTWQDPSSGNADTHSSSSNPSVINKHKVSSTASSISGVIKSNLSLASANVDLMSGSNEAITNYVPQPKLVEQLGWDEPDIQVTKRPNFDDGTSVWGDPMDLTSATIKKWTDGTKAASKTSSNTILSQSTSQTTSSAVPGTPTASAIAPSQPVGQKPAPISNPPSQMGMQDTNWPKQQSPTLGQQSSSQWYDQSVSSNLDPIGLPQQAPMRGGQSNWTPHSPHPVSGGGDEWLRDGFVDTSGWGLQGPPHKVPFDPYDGQIDTSGWGVSSAGGMPGVMPGMPRTPFPNEYPLGDNPHDPHQGRMASFERGSLAEIYRQNSEGKNPMMGMNNMQQLPSNMQVNQGPFAPRPMNPTGGLSNPPGAIMGQGNLLSPKIPTPSPIPTQNQGVQLTSKPSANPNHLTNQQHLSGNGNHPNGNNNGGVHAQIMQQFRLAVQAGLISQDLLNTKLPPHMLQLLQKLFEFQQKFQNLSVQLGDLGKQKSRFPPPVFQNEYERLSKSIQQKKQEMLSVQKEIQEAHNKLKQQQQQQSGNMNPSPMMNNAVGGSNPDQSRLHQWTKQSNPGGQRSGMFPPPGIPPKDWQTDNHDSNDNWDQSQTNESNQNNPMGNVDNQIHHQGGSSSFNDPFSNIVEDIDGPPPFVPGQLWNWRSTGPNAEDDPHATPSSFVLGPKGLASPMGNLSVGGADSAFTNTQFMHQYQRNQQSNRSQWPPGFPNDQPSFGQPMNDWNKPHPSQHQYRGPSKPPHPSFGGGYRQYP